MKYDIVKDKIAFFIKLIPGLRKLFYKALNALILRQQYVLSHMRLLYPDRRKEFKMYDAGGGYLQYTDFVLSNYPKANVLAVDIKKDYIEDYSYYIKNTDKDSRFKYQYADLQYFIPDDKFDLIIAIDILEHIEDDVSVLNNFKKVLGNEGKLIISTPSTFDEAAAFTEEHVRPGYDIEDLKGKLTNSGFCIDKITYTYGTFGAMYWKMAMKFPLLFLQHSKLAYILLPFYYLVSFPLISLLMKLDQKKQNRVGNGIMVIASNKRD